MEQGAQSGLYRWAERLAIPVRTTEVPLWEVAQVLADPTGNCALTMGDGSWSPLEEEVGPGKLVGRVNLACARQCARSS